MRADLKAKLLAVIALAAVGGLVAGVRAVSTAPHSPASVSDVKASSNVKEAPPEIAADGRAVLGRAWFDRLPTSNRDEVDFWVFLSGGLGLQLRGSNFRWSTELFDLERAKNRLELVTLQDKKTIQFTFEIKACDDKPPFDLCLYPSEPLRGKKVLYGFGDEEDAAHRLGWFRDLRARSQAELALAKPSARD